MPTPMPSGVEHFVATAPMEETEIVMPTPMPSGVEHNIRGSIMGYLPNGDADSDAFGR